MQAGEAQVGNRRIRCAGGADQHFQTRQDDLGGTHIGAISRFVIKLAGGWIDIPLVGFRQESQAVLQQQVRPLGMERVGDTVIAPDIVRPGRLLHGDDIAGDLFHRREARREEALALDLDTMLIEKAGQIQANILEHHAGFGEGDGVARNLHLGAFGQLVIDPELAAVRALRHIGDIDVFRGVIDGPARDLDTAG